MNDQQLINQLKSLKNIHPDTNWVALTRTQLHNTNPQMMANVTNIFDRIFAFPVPRMATIPVMAAVVALVGGVMIAQDANYDEGNFVASVRSKSLLTETKQELKEIANPHKSVSFTVVFNEGADKQESFKNELRSRIEAKIGKIKDLFAQLEDGALSREISLNPRRLEENFKLADAEIGKQVKSLLLDAEAALAEGNLIDALDLMNAIEKLLD